MTFGVCMTLMSWGKTGLKVQDILSCPGTRFRSSYFACCGDLDGQRKPVVHLGLGLGPETKAGPVGFRLVSSFQISGLRNLNRRGFTVLNAFGQDEIANVTMNFKVDFQFLLTNLPFNRDYAFRRVNFRWLNASMIAKV